MATEVAHPPDYNAPLEEAGAEGNESNAPDDRGGYFEFVNPNALERVEEEGDDDFGDYVVSATTAAAAVSCSEASAGGNGLDVIDAGFFAAMISGTDGCSQFCSDDVFYGDAVQDSDLTDLSSAEIEAVVQASLRQLHREHSEVSGPAAAAAEPLPVPAGLGAEKAAKLAQLRAALAAARAAAAAAASTSGAGVHHPVMELAPGADEFPEDYDQLQALDSAGVGTAAGSTGHAGARAAGSASSRGYQAAAVATEAVATAAPGSASTLTAASASPEFDPFGTGDVLAAGHRSLVVVNKKPTGSGSSAARSHAAPAAPPVPRRPVSPLAPEIKSEIRAAMARITISPRGGVPAWSERVVQAALLQTQAARRAPS
jgi:hypothetical protein